MLALSIGTTVHPLRDIVWFVYIRKLGQVTLVEASAPQEIEFIRRERNIIVDVFEVAQSVCTCEDVMNRCLKPVESK